MLRKKIQGFTLLEVLVVVAIVGLLSTVVLASLSGARKKARDARRMADLKSIQQALVLFYGDNGEYPRGSYTSMEESNWQTLSAYLVPAYMPALPKDPLNSGENSFPYFPNSFAYNYSSPSVGEAQDYNLITQIENISNPNRCELKCWQFHNGNGTSAGSWCNCIQGSGFAGETFSRYIYADH